MPLITVTLICLDSENKYQCMVHIVNKFMKKMDFAKKR